MEGAAIVAAAKASPPATDDTKAAIRPPSEEAWRRRVTGFIGNGRCVRLSPGLAQSELVASVDRPQQPEGAPGTNLLHMVGQKETGERWSAISRTASPPPVIVQTSQTPRITDAS